MTDNCVRYKVSGIRYQVPGGGRSEISPRLSGKLHLICLPDHDDVTLEMIVITMISPQLFHVGKLVHSIAKAMVQAYRSVVASLVPTPRNFFYTFNARDVTRVCQGMLLACASGSQDLTKPQLVRLWAHESLRVFGDRLTQEEDRDWLASSLWQSVTDLEPVLLKSAFGSGDASCINDLVYGHFTNKDHGGGKNSNDGIDGDFKVGS